MKKPDNPMGFDLLKRQAIASAVDLIEGIFEDTSFFSGDSEIEKLFHAAVFNYCRFGWSHFHAVALAPSPELAERARTINREFNERILLVERQVQIEAFRVDFVISAWTGGTVLGGMDGPVVGQPRWRKLVVECDGHEYHERTKEQAAKDRSRDRALTSLGFDVFRFTGSELWRDPWSCAAQVHDWAQRGMS